ncbi:MAG: glycosyltransferase [Burkholderiaceae bacterium]
MRIMAFALNAWDGQWMNRQQLLSRLARRHQIVYSNGPFTVWDRAKPEWPSSAWLGDFEARDGVWVDRPPKLLMDRPGRSLWASAVGRVAAARWQRQLRTMGDGPVVSYVFHPSLQAHAERIQRKLLVYHPYDMFSLAPDWNPALETAQLRLLNESDIVIASSEPIRCALQAQSGRKVLCVPNGVDALAFMQGGQQKPPEDIARIPRPRLGYVGSVNRKVDFSTIADLANREPNWHFVLLGPLGSMDEASSAALRRCCAMPNVYLLPPRPVDRLPACVAALDVGLLCYRRETWMEFGYPLKLHEFMASGVPLVSTPLASIREFEQYIDVANSPDEWHEALTRVLGGSERCSPASRQAIAMKNTWDARVDRIHDLLSSAVEEPVHEAASGRARPGINQTP